MPYLHSFGPDDILQNRMVARPKFDFVMYSGSAYINNDGEFLGENITTGTINLFEYIDNMGKKPKSLINTSGIANNETTGIIF